MEDTNTIATDTTHRLPVGWNMLQLEDVVDILDSKRVPINAKERENRVGQVPYYGATGQVGWIDDHLFEEELILLGEDGAPFLDSTKQKAYIIRGKSWVNNHAHVLRARNGIPNPYIKYYLDTVDYHDFVTGTTRLKLNQAMMRKIPVPVAPPNEQKLIVAEIEKQFSRLDEAVANLKRVKANLKRYKAAVLKAAVEGKLTEEWRKAHPNVERASELLKRILSDRRKKWEEVELAKMKTKGKKPTDDKWKDKYVEPATTVADDLPALPSKWTWVTVQQMGQVQLGKMLDAQKHRSGEKLPYLRNINVRWGSVNTNDLSEMYFKEQELDRYGLKTGDVLVCEGGEPGRAAVWDGRVQGMKYQKALHRARFIDGYEALLLVFNLEYLAKSGRLEKLFTGSTIKHFTGESFSILPIPLPPREEQTQIVSEVESRLTVISQFEVQVNANIIRAERLRQAVLHRAFSGSL